MTTDTNTYGRFAKASTEYVNEIMAAQKRMAGRTLSAAEKDAQLRNILASRDGFLKLGQSMIGPIQLKLRYEGIVRNVLVEDPIEPGVPVQYDVLDQWGQAYILHSTDGEVKIDLHEGKRVEVKPFRIAAFPTIKKEDLYLLRAKILENAQDEAKQAIMRMEDSRLVTLIEAAIAQFQVNNPEAKKGQSIPNEVTVAGNYVSYDDVITARTSPSVRQIESTRILCNPRDYYDFYRWDINTTGFAFKDRVVAGETITEFGDFQIGKSLVIPAGTMYLAPDPNFLGMMPIWYSLDAEENNKVESFKRGFVLDELIGMVILNAAGLVALRKA